MKIQKNNQINSLLYSGKNIINGNRQKNNKSPLLPNTQIAAYKVDTDIKSDTIKDKLMRKRTQLLSEIKGKNIDDVKTVQMHWKTSSDDEDDVISYKDLPDLLKVLEKYQKGSQNSSADDKSGATENVANADIADDKFQKQVDDIAHIGRNSAESVGQRQDENKNLFAKTVTVDEKSAPLGKKIKAETTEKNVTKLNITVISELPDKINAESSIIKEVNNIFNTLSDNFSEFKRVEAEGGKGFAQAKIFLGLSLDSLARSINGYSTGEKDKTFFDNIISALNNTKQSLSADQEVKSDSGKASVVETTKLIDYITNMFEKGKAGIQLETRNAHYEDADNILANEFGSESGESLSDDSDRMINNISWKYQQYKKRFMDNLDKYYMRVPKNYQYSDGSINFDELLKKCAEKFC